MMVGAPTPAARHLSVASFDDAADLNRLRDIFTQRLAATKTQPILDERFEDGMDENLLSQADQAALQLGALPQVLDDGRYGNLAPRPPQGFSDYPPHSELRFAGGGPVEIPYEDDGYYGPPDFLFQTPESHAGDGYPAQVYAGGGEVEGYYDYGDSDTNSDPDNVINREWARLKRRRGPLGYLLEGANRLTSNSGTLRQDESGRTVVDSGELTLRDAQNFVDPNFRGEYGLAGAAADGIMIPLSVMGGGALARAGISGGRALAAQLSPMVSGTGKGIYDALWGDAGDGSAHAAQPKYAGGGEVEHHQSLGPVAAKLLKRIPNPIKAHHGSPYDIDRFDLSKIGTGEGNQSYGHGLYFAENPAVARMYRDEVMNTGYFDEVNGRMGQIAKEMDTYKVPGTMREFKDPRGYDLAREYDRLLDERGAKRGHLYDVDLHADPHKFLDWDKRLADQPEMLGVADNLLRSKYAPALGGLRDAARVIGRGTDLGNVVGQDLYRHLPDPTGGSMYKSMLLRDEYGVPGIKYLDQGSRGVGEGTRNYSVFDDSIIDITRKYQVGGGVKETTDPNRLREWRSDRTPEEERAERYNPSAPLLGGDVTNFTYTAPPLKKADGGRIAALGRKILQLHGKTQGDRFARAADETNLERYSDKGLLDLFNPERSGLLAALPPENFQKFALQLPEKYLDEVPYGRWKSNVPNFRGVPAEERTADAYLDQLLAHKAVDPGPRAGSLSAQPGRPGVTPALWLNKTIDDLTQVEGHEGRHTMMALARAGDRRALTSLLPANSGELRFPLDERLDYLTQKYFPRGAKTPVLPEAGQARPSLPFGAEPFQGGGSVLTRLARHALGKPKTIKIPGHGEVDALPIKEFEDVATKFATKHGNEYPITQYPEFDEANARRIADAYDAMKHDPSDPRVKRAYDALIDETMDQYRALKDTGADFSFLKPGEADPYARTPTLGYLDLINNGRLRVFPTDQGYGTLADIQNNPLLRRVGPVGDLPDGTANDAFRIVHDALGHFGPGNPFFRHKGEERAWNSHARSYSRDALPAATSETRGQNSWVNFGPHREKNATASGADTTYADQKAGLLPEWAWQEKADGGPVEYHQKIGPVGKAIAQSWRAKRAHDLDAEVRALNKGQGKPENPFISPEVDPKLQTVDDPRRVMFPLIYSDPKDTRRMAEMTIVPDPGKDGPLYRLFKRTRQSLDEQTQSERAFDVDRPAHLMPFLPPERGTGSAVSEQVTNPRNARRLVDAYSEGLKNPDLRQMRSWYGMTPLYDLMERLGVSDRGKQALNARMGVMSPQASPASEIPRGFMANHLANNGRLEDFIRYGGLTDEQRAAFPGFPKDMYGAPGHKNHAAHVPNLLEFEQLGRLWAHPSKNKVGVYIGGSDPILPSYNQPTADSHFTRHVGLPDVRTARTRGVLAQNMSNPEYGDIYPWYNEKVAKALDLRPRDAQSLGWGLFGKATGVRATGAPKLELIADYMEEVAKARGISPESARDRLLTGDIGGKARGGAVNDDLQKYHAMWYAGGGAVDEAAPAAAPQAATPNAGYWDDAPEQAPKKRAAKDKPSKDVQMLTKLVAQQTAAMGVQSDMINKLVTTLATPQKIVRDENNRVKEIRRDVIEAAQEEVI